MIPSTVDLDKRSQQKPGAQLAANRELKGVSKEYIANKLHLRLSLIEALEADDYKNMAEPVFIKGYIRAYAGLLQIEPEPLITSFNLIHVPEKKIEKALWQSRRETHKIEHAIRWLTSLFALGVLIAIAVWWNKSKENERILPATVVENEMIPLKSDHDIRVTDLSKMHSLLSSGHQNDSQEQ
ncbi:MAG: helix-turn-helix domain-containing protein [Legionella sp.]